MMIQRYLLFFFLCILNTTFTQSSSYRTAIIAFYNLENLYDTINQKDVQDDEFTPTGSKNYTPKVYREKLHNLSKVISEIGIEVNIDGPAILGVAEIENRSVLEDFSHQQSIINRNYQIAHYDSKDERGVDVALLYNPKYFRVIKSRTLYVNIGREGGKESTRDILWVNGLLHGEEINVFVAHWPSRRGGEEASAGKRAIAANTARKVIDTLLRKDINAKIVYMGDLNDDPVSPSVTKYLKASGQLKKIKPDELFNPFFDYYKNGIGTLAYNDSWNLFDQIIISQGWLDKKQSGFYFQKAMIFNRPYLTSTTGNFKGYPHRTYVGDNYVGGYSDHFPTYLILYKKME